MGRIYLGLGANLGSRRGALAGGVRALRRAGVALDRLSSLWETEPQDCPPGSPAFLNMVASLPLEGAPGPVELLGIALGAERAAGRTRGVPNEPRTLDIDVLLYGDLVRSAGAPLVPHPRMHRRPFVLEPLAEIAPGLVHPVLDKTVEELREAAAPRGSARRVGVLDDAVLVAPSYCRSPGPML